MHSEGPPWIDNRQDIIGTRFTAQGKSHCVYEGPDITDRIRQLPALAHPEF
ncbi:UNVERIFIED_ORG: hypothetical protein M2402_005004 [Rahnella aquatilis]